MRKLLLLLLCAPLIGFAQERYSFLETTWNGDPGIVLLYSTNQPVTGVVYDTTYGHLSWEENYLNGIKNGIQRRYYLSGELSVEEHYKNGEKDGLWIYYNNNQTIWREIYFSDGLDTTLIDYFYGKDNQLIRKETRNRDANLDKYALWWPKPMRLAYNTIETFHKLYDCKGIFCNKKQHYEYILNINSDECFNSEYFLQCEYYKISEYELFLSKHKNHKFSDKLRQDLLKFKEERDYKLAKKINTIDGYNTFVSLYPNSKKNQDGYNDGTLERIILIDLITEYNNILNLNSVEAWEDFLSKYPTNCKICMSDRVYEDAKYYLSFSKDLNAFAKATDEGSYESYSEYLVNCTPLRYNGPNREAAVSRIDSIVDPEWERVQKKNEVSSYREFMNTYLNSSYSNLARIELDSLELSYLKKFEEAFLEFETKKSLFVINKDDDTYIKRMLKTTGMKVIAEKPISAYRDYQKNFKHGKYIQPHHLKKLMECEIAYEESQGTFSGSLPTINQDRDTTIESSEHIFRIINMTRDIGNKTPKTLLVTYRGITSEGLVNDSYTVNIDGCENKSLSPGSYYFTVEAKSAKNIRKFRDNEPRDLKGGSRHELQLGIFPENYIQQEQSIEEAKKLYKKYKNCYSKEEQLLRDFLYEYYDD